MKIKEDYDHLGNPIPYDPHDVHKKLERWFYVYIGLFIVVLITYSARFYSYSFSNDPAHWGQFGDYIGGILNPIVTGLALFITIYLQKSFVRFTETITRHQSDTQRVQLNTQVLYELAKDYSQQANAILRKVETAHHSKNIYDLRISLSELQAFHLYWLTYNKTLFNEHWTLTDFPISYFKTYIAYIDKYGDKLFTERDTASGFDLEMVQNCVGVTIGNLYKAIPERARSREVFAQS
jgi:hypothetical protein